MFNIIPTPLNKAGNISVMYFSDIFSPIFLIKNALLGLTLRGRTHRVSTSYSHLLTQNASLGWLSKRKSPHSQIGYEGEWNRGSTSCSQTAHAACLNKFDNQPLAVTGYPGSSYSIQKINSQMWLHTSVCFISTIRNSLLLRQVLLLLF